MQTPNPLIARPLYESPNCAWLRLFLGQEIPHTHTINVARLTKQEYVQPLTPLAMTRLGPRIEPITSLTRRSDALRVSPISGISHLIQMIYLQVYLSIYLYIYLSN